MTRTRPGVHAGAIFAIVLLGLAIFLRPALEQFRQRSAFSELGRATARQYNWEWAPSSPAWLFDHFTEKRKHWGDWIIGASVWRFTFDSHELESLRAMPHLRRLSLGPSVAANAALESFPQLETLYVNGPSRSSSLRIRNCSKLAEVSIYRVYSADFDISDLPKLQELRLSNVNPKCRIKLTDVPSLRTISVVGASGFVDDGVFTLRDLPGLETVRLDFAVIRAVDFSSLPKLRQLCVRYSQLDDAGITSLCGLQELQSLQLFHCGLSDASLAKLDDLPSLTALELRATDVSAEGLAGLSRFPRLRELSVDWAMTSTERQELQRALPGVIINSPFRLKNTVHQPAVIALQ